MSDFCTDVFIPSNLTKASLNLGSSKVVVTGCRNCNHNQNSLITTYQHIWSLLPWCC